MTAVDSSTQSNTTEKRMEQLFLTSITCYRAQLPRSTPNALQSLSVHEAAFPSTSFARSTRLLHTLSVSEKGG